MTEATATITTDDLDILQLEVEEGIYDALLALDQIVTVRKEGTAIHAAALPIQSQLSTIFTDDYLATLKNAIGAERGEQGAES